MPNTERAFDLLDDNRYDDREDAPTCLWCGDDVYNENTYCSSACEAEAQNDSEEAE